MGLETILEKEGIIERVYHLGLSKLKDEHEEIKEIIEFLENPSKNVEVERKIEDEATIYTVTFKNLGKTIKIRFNDDGFIAMNGEIGYDLKDGKEMVWIDDWYLGYWKGKFSRDFFSRNRIVEWNGKYFRIRPGKEEKFLEEVSGYEKKEESIIFRVFRKIGSYIKKIF